MPTAIIKQKDAEKVLKYLREKSFIDTERYLEKRKDTLVIPIIQETKFLKSHKVTVSNEELPLKKKHLDFKEEAEKVLSVEERKKLKTAFDMIGNIAVLEIDKELDKKAKNIAEILLKINPKIKTVVRKKGAHEGELRLQQYEYLAGEKSLSTIHKENGCFLHIILGEVYYSPRSATERLRVASKVKRGENVMVLFSGCAPFVCTIAKNTEAKEVYGIELNEKGHELGAENIEINKLKNAHLVCGDVREIKSLVDKKIIPAKFDRIIMPLPKNASEFLEYAFVIAKKGTVIHLYDFASKEDFPKKIIQEIKEICKKSGERITVVETALCGQFSPKMDRVCIDFKIN